LPKIDPGRWAHGTIDQGIAFRNEPGMKRIVSHCFPISGSRSGRSRWLLDPFMFRAPISVIGQQVESVFFKQLFY
jgi:hypothetical protein